MTEKQLESSSCSGLKFKVQEEQEHGHHGRKIRVDVDQLVTMSRRDTVVS